METKDHKERKESQEHVMLRSGAGRTGAPNDDFRKNICSEDDLRSRISKLDLDLDLETFVVKFLACLPLLEFSNIYKMVQLPIFNGIFTLKRSPRNFGNLFSG